MFGGTSALAAAFLGISVLGGEPVEVPDWNGGWVGTPVYTAPGGHEQHECLQRKFMVKYRPYDYLRERAGELLIWRIPDCGFQSDMNHPMDIDIQRDGTLTQRGELVGSFTGYLSLQIVYSKPDFKESLDLELLKTGEAIELRKVFTLRTTLKSWTIHGRFQAQ